MCSSTLNRGGEDNVLAREHERRLARGHCASARRWSTSSASGRSTISPEADAFVAPFRRRGRQRRGDRRPRAAPPVALAGGRRRRRVGPLAARPAARRGRRRVAVRAGRRIVRRRWRWSGVDADGEPTYRGLRRSRCQPSWPRWATTWRTSVGTRRRCSSARTRWSAPRNARSRCARQAARAGRATGDLRPQPAASPLGLARRRRGARQRLRAGGAARAGQRGRGGADDRRGTIPSGRPRRWWTAGARTGGDHARRRRRDPARRAAGGRPRGAGARASARSAPATCSPGRCWRGWPPSGFYPSAVAAALPAAVEAARAPASAGGRLTEPRQDRLAQATDPRRVRAIRDRLRLVYGIPRRRPHGHPIAELILTVLSQSTNDRNRDVAYLALRERFPRPGRRSATRPSTRSRRRSGRAGSRRSSRRGSSRSCGRSRTPPPGVSCRSTGCPSSACPRRRRI